MKATTTLLRAISVCALAGVAAGVPVEASAATSQVICLTTSGQLRVSTRCRAGDTLLTAANFGSALGLTSAPGVRATPMPKPTTSPATSTINLGSCYTTSGQRSASTFDGRIAVGVQCNKSTHVLLSSEFTTSETSGAKPKLERQRLILSGRIPNGIEIGTVGENNRIYTLRVSAVCCESTS